MKTFEFDYVAFQNRLASITDVSDRELALLEDTVSFYNSKNRSTYRNTCMCLYQATENSPGCAIGRCMDRNNVYIASASINHLFTIKYPFPTWLIEMDKTFLTDLQILHDDPNFWNDTGISDFGREYAEYIKNNIEQRRKNKDPHKS